MKIGFIGQGWIGKNYADNFERRGFEVVRYAKEDPYAQNKEEIKKCDIVFIAVPTPTTPKGFDNSILKEVLVLIGRGKIAVIKSTVVLGTTELLQKENSHIIVVHSPEFLSESTARDDADNPTRNIVGITKQDTLNQQAAKAVIGVLPDAPYTLVCTATEAEVIKYSHNISGYFQVLLGNMLYDFANQHNCDWDVLKDAYLADPMMSHTYLNPVHKKGRGAGGHCFIKDFAAFIQMYETALPNDSHGVSLLKSLEEKNKILLRESGKDIDILDGVYGTNN